MRNLNPLITTSKRLFLLSIAGFLLIVSINGCSTSSLTPTGKGSGFSAPLPDGLFSGIATTASTTVSASIVVDGGDPISLAVDLTNKTVSGEVDNLSPGNHTFTINYYLNGVLAASATTSGNISAGSLTPIQFTRSMVIYYLPKVAGSVQIDGTKVGVGQIGVNPNTDQVYVNRSTNTTDSIIRVVDVTDKTNPTIVTSITGNATGVAVNPLTNRFYTSDGFGGHILVYEGVTNSLVISVLKGYCNSGVDIDTTVNLIYYFSQCGGGNDPVQVLDGVTNTLLGGPLGSGGVAGGIHVNPVTHRAYASIGTSTRVFGPSPSFSVLTDLARIAIQGVNPVTNRLYFSSGSDLQVLDGNSHSLIAVIAGAGGALGINTKRNRLYIPDQANQVVKIVDGATNVLVGTFSLGTTVTPVGIPAVDSTKGRIYIAGYDSGTTRLYVIEDTALLDITVVPSSPVLNVGQTLQFSAMGTFGDGSRNILTGGGGSWTTKTSMSAARCCLPPTAGVVNNVIYATGGAIPGGCQLATNEAYDPSADTWMSKASMPTGRWYPAVGVVNGILYVVGGGGCAIGSGAKAINEAYNPTTNSWTTKASMSTVREGLGVGVVNGILYAVGGSNGGGIVGTNEAYDPSTDTWTTKAPMPTPRASLGVVVINGILYAVGGGLGTNEAYDPSTDTWTTKAPMPIPNGGMAVGVVNGILYAVNQKAFETYNPATDTWTITLSPMPTARGGLSGGVVNGVLYAIGGGGSGAFATNEAFAPPNVIWVSSNPNVAKITEGGLATGMGAGTTVITAISGTVSGNTNLNIR